MFQCRYVPANNTNSSIPDTGTIGYCSVDTGISLQQVSVVQSDFTGAIPAIRTIQRAL